MNELLLLDGLVASGLLFAIGLAALFGGGRGTQPGGRFVMLAAVVVVAVTTGAWQQTQWGQAIGLAVLLLGGARLWATSPPRTTAVEPVAIEDRP